jgi:hypothetical protein
VAQFDSIRFQPSRPLLKEISADRLNAILSEIKKNRPRGERGITVRQAGDATYIGLATALPRGGTFTPTALQPWDLIARVDPDADPEDENPSYLVTVRPGTLNNFLSSNWDIEESLPSNGTIYYAKAVITTDGQNISSVQIVIDDEPPQVQEAQEFFIEETIEYLFGIFCDGEKYRVIANGNITLLPRNWMVVSPEPPAQPGELPYRILYRLQP